MENTEIIKALRECEYCDVCSIAVDGDCPFGGRNALEVAAADALEADEKRIAALEDELRFQLDTRRKETAEIERLKAENLKLQKQNRDCGWNCKQCEYVDKDLQIVEKRHCAVEMREARSEMQGRYGTGELKH